MVGKHNCENCIHKNDVTDAFCARIESGEFLDHQKRVKS